MEKISYPGLFTHFQGREADLRNVTRYHIYKPMYYRSNLFTHSKRVVWLLQSILPLVEEVFGSQFDSTKAQLIAVVHDDPEIVMGDIQAGHKRKMTPAQLAEVERQEQAAIEKMVERFPFTIQGYSYRDLMSEGQQVKTLEAKLVKYIDRFDAFGEALHEVIAGNQAFTTPSVHPEFGVIDLPVVFYQKYLSSFPKNNPEFNKLFISYHDLLTPPETFNQESFVSCGSPHTNESVLQDSNYRAYDVWKKIILESGDEEEIQNLFLQKESYGF